MCPLKEQRIKPSQAPQVEPMCANRRPLVSEQNLHKELPATQCKPEILNYISGEFKSGLRFEVGCFGY